MFFIPSGAGNTTYMFKNMRSAGRRDVHIIIPIRRGGINRRNYISIQTYTVYYVMKYHEVYAYTAGAVMMCCSNRVFMVFRNTNQNSVYASVCSCFRTSIGMGLPI